MMRMTMRMVLSGFWPPCLILWSSLMLVCLGGAPEITVAPDDQKVVENGIASFFCQATGNPQPEIYWRKGGRRIAGSRPRYLIVTTPDGGASVLRIDPVKSRKDDGQLECYADNGIGGGYAAQAKLEVYPSQQDASAGYPRIIEGPFMRAVDKDQSVMMRCSAAGTPTPIIQWVKDFLPLPIQDARFRIHPNGSLEIAQVRESDEGKYECSAKNSAGVAYSNSANLYVQVRRLPPLFSIPPENTEVMPGGEVNLTCVAIGSPMPFVKWRLGTVDLTPEENIPIGKNVLRLLDIKESATYTCVAASDLGSVEVSAEIRVKALPRPPIRLRASDVTSTTVRLKWMSANAEPVESYVLRYKRKGTDEAYKEVIDITGTEYPLMHLGANSIYEVHVLAVNSIGRSLPGASVEVATREAAPSSSPRNVRARPLTSSSVVVQWEEPENSNGVIKGYKIYFTMTPNLPMTSWTTLQTVDSGQLVTISNLAVNQTYTIAVLAFTSAGEGPLSEPIQVKIQQEVYDRVEILTLPGQPTNVIGRATSAQSIQLTWEAPQTSADNLDSYEIYYNDSGRQIHINVSPPRNSYLVEDLTPNTKYTIRITARSSRGEGTHSSPVVIQTLEAAPSAPPQMVRGEAVDSTSFRVTWDAPPMRDQNGQILGYRVQYSEAKGSQAGPDPSVDMATLPSSETSYVVRGLRKWTLYSIQILAYTAKGDGPLSDVIMVQTAEDVPGEPRKVKLEAVNSTAISVQWRPPLDKELNGIIRGYQIYYTRLDDNEEPIGSTLMQDVMDGKATETILPMLHTDTEYQVQVAAYTRKGDGERSRPRKVRTKEAVLSSPRSLQLSLVQEDPPVVSMQWQAPRTDPSLVLGYRVQYGPSKSETFEEEKLDPAIYKFTSGFLERGVEYEFRVSAKNSVDYGEPSSEKLTTPDGIPAGAPLNVSGTSITSTGVRLSWNPPELHHRNGEIVLYEIMYHQELNFVDDWTTNTTDTWIVIEGLTSGTGYLFQTRAYTSQGSGPWSSPLEIFTLGQGVVQPPGNIALKRVSSSVLRVNWDASTTPGVAGYQVFYSMHATSNMSRWHFLEVGTQQMADIQNLQPQSVYAVRIRTKLTDGRLSDFSKVVIDNFVLQDHVRDVMVRKQNAHSILLEWSLPKKSEVSFYKVEYYGTKKYRDSDGLEQQLVSEGQKVVPSDQTSVYVDNLEPYTWYRFNVSAKFLDGSWGAVNTILAETIVDAPPEIRVPLFQRFTSESSMLVQLFPASEKNGPVLYYYVIVVPSEEAERRVPDSFSINELLKVGNFSTHSSWIAARFDFLPKMFKVGEGTSPGNSGFFNKPLTRGHAFRIFVRGYTAENKYSSSPYSKPVFVNVKPEVIAYESGPAGMELLYFVAPICIAIVLILLVVLLIVFIRRRTCKKDQLPMKPMKVLLMPGEVAPHPHDPVEQRRLNFQTPGMVSHPPISVADLAEVVERLKVNDGDGFSREFESIEPGQQFTWDVSSKDVNKGKNRYANVITYDHSRVILQMLDDIPGSDYINANYMDGYCKHNAYIATQGPLPETFGDFWRMIWEQQTSTIVMMTKLEERTRVKCDQYWPNRGTEVYGIIQVTIADVLELATFTMRTFQIGSINSIEKREIRQFQFTAWPDHGVPDHPSPLLNFIRRVKTFTPPDSGPVVVHCSAGVGRTGAFIVIDAMLERIQHEKTLDVYGHVTCLRAQRNYMVQTEDQYVFIYDALLEAIESGNTEVQADNLYAHVQRIMQIDPGETISGMELEFKKLNSMRINPSSFTSASLPANKYKNRLVNILPFESTRVCLQPIRGVEGSDYINANFVDGYRFRRAFIATQGPLTETTEEFWRMLWEHSCTIIVMMTRLKELNREKCHQYWPEERSARYQYFVVDPVAQYNMPLYILREFKVTDARDGQSRIVRQFQFTDWPDQGVPSSGEGFIEFIGHVQKTKEQFGQDGPIIVHCSVGVGRTGVFIALSIVLERMRYEGLVDLFQTVKMLRTQRPAMVQNEDQYGFCYRAALEYLGSFDHYAS